MAQSTAGRGLRSQPPEGLLEQVEYYAKHLVAIVLATGDVLWQRLLELLGFVQAKLKSL